MFIGHTVIVLCALGQIGVEAKIQIIYEDAEITSIDATYFDPVKTNLFITDDNKVSGNTTIVKKIPTETDCHAMLLGYSMGEYVVPTGINWWYKFCELLRDPIIYGPLYNKMGISADSCPPEPGDYILNDYATPTENLPETFHENKYRWTFDMVYEGKTIYGKALYIDIRN